MKRADRPDWRTGALADMLQILRELALLLGIAAVVVLMVCLAFALADIPRKP